MEIPVPSCFKQTSRLDPLSGRTIISLEHSSGLVLKVLPFPGFAEKFAALTVPFGSIQTRLRLEGKDHDLPAGTAHFLEHCAFDQDDDGGLAGQLAQLGASANAYTSYDHTLYYFKTVANFTEAFFIWLKSILEPQLDAERVEAERPIIQAELAGYQDDPTARLSQLLLEKMYRTHPVREDIGGTAHSVARIGAADLQLAHRLFYGPGRISLTIAGDFTDEGLFDRLARWLAKGAGQQPAATVELKAESGPPWATAGLEMMDLAVPLFLLGCKGTAVPTADAFSRLARQRTTALLLDTLLSPVSALSDSLYQEGLINGSFGYLFAAEPTFMFLAAGGESSEPELAAERLLTGLTRARLDQELFYSQKKAALGNVLKLTDSVAGSGLAQARLNLMGLDIFDYAAVYAKINADQVQQQFSFLADPANYVTALIKPRR